ncbi:MAG: hypothetical protein SVO26_07250 [Chloroflexota bacterium]|nr:hypothetical protein [Chloroflexota bacterium]
MHIHSSEYEHEHDPGVEHTHEHDHEHVHDHEHSHEHLQSYNQGGTRAGYGLVVIIGLTPCVALLPIVFAATPLGFSSVLSIMAVFFAATLGTILLVTTLALTGLQLIRLEFFEKHGEVITGLVIALIGFLVVGMGM